VPDDAFTRCLGCLCHPGHLRVPAPEKKHFPYRLRKEQQHRMVTTFLEDAGSMISFYVVG
jgi:hypothetical protein